MEFNTQHEGLAIAEGQFSIRYRDREKSYQCRVTFDLTRDHYFLIDCLESVHELGLDPMPKEPFFVGVSASAKPIKCIVVRARQQLIGEDAYTHVTLTPQGPEGTVNYDARISRLSAGIPNLFQYWCGGARKLGFRLQGGDWIFEFTPVGEETLLYPNQVQNDSYSFTHHLELRKNKGETFSCTEALEALGTLSVFLRFCSEHWICPVLIVGFDEVGKVAMEDWGTGKVDPRLDPTNWLDRHHGSAMTEIFPGFWRLMEDSVWRDAVRTAVYWYARADTNYVGPDGAIVLIQAALERLAWHILVQHRHAISEDGFLKLPAADLLRLLLDASSIPLRLPASVAQLTAAAKSRNWVDGPQAFVEMRNQIVHPKRRSKVVHLGKVKGGHPYYEAYLLGKWYLELILLRACGFDGQYANRLRMDPWVGQVETVPWAEPRP